MLTLTPRIILHSAKGDAVETKCSRLRLLFEFPESYAWQLSVSCLLLRLCPPSTAPHINCTPSAEYPIIP